MLILNIFFPCLDEPFCFLFFFFQVLGEFWGSFGALKKGLRKWNWKKQLPLGRETMFKDNISDFERIWCKTQRQKMINRKGIFELKTCENCRFGYKNANPQHICKRNCLYFSYVQRFHVPSLLEGRLHPGLKPPSWFSSLIY